MRHEVIGTAVECLLDQEMVAGRKNREKGGRYGAHAACCDQRGFGVGDRGELAMQEACDLFSVR